MFLFSPCLNHLCPPLFTIDSDLLPISDFLPILTFFYWKLLSVFNHMTADACIAGDAYPVDAPGLTPFGVHVIEDCV